MNMNAIILGVADAMIREPGLPNLHRRTQLFLCLVRKATFDELHCAFKSYGWGNQYVEVFWQQDIFVKQICAASIRMQSFEKQISPLWVSK